MAAVQPDATVARLQERSAPALADLAPATPAAPISRFSAFPLPAVEISVLLIRGDSMFETGDIVSARLFYERAAAAGSGQAALRLGESFDPHFLEQAHLRGVRDDLSAAAFWYQRARELGMDEAKILLGSLRDK
jgi:TPR repeat protein